MRKQCPYCDKMLSSEAFLEQHIRTIHKELGEKHGTAHV